MFKKSETDVNHNRIDIKGSNQDAGAASASTVTANSVVYSLAGSSDIIPLNIAGATGSIAVALDDTAQSSVVSIDSTGITFLAGQHELPDTIQVPYTVTDDLDVHTLSVTVVTLPADYQPSVSTAPIFVLDSVTSIPVSITAYGDRTVTLTKADASDPQSWSINSLGVITPIGSGSLDLNAHLVNITVTDQFGTATGTVAINVETTSVIVPRIDGLTVVHMSAPDLPIKSLVSTNLPTAVFTIKAGFDGALFEIVNGNELKFINPSVQGGYAVIIVATDPLEGVFSETTIVASATSPAGIYPVYTDVETSFVVVVGDTFVTQSVVSSTALPLSFSVSGDDAALFGQAADGTLSFLAPATQGTYNVISDVVDVNGLPSQRGYFINVPAPSGGASSGTNPPVFTDSNAVTSSVNTSVVLTPVATGSTTLQFTLTSSDLAVNINGQTGQITLQTIPSVAGAYTIVIRAMDYNSAWTENTYSVNLV